MENEIGPITNLTLDIAKGRPHIEEMLRKLLSNNRLEIDPTPYESFTDIIEGENAVLQYKIHISPTKLPPKIERAVLFSGQSFSQSEKVQHRLLHELSHIRVEELMMKADPNMKSLISIVENLHEEDGLFFTGMASFAAKKPSLWFRLLHPGSKKRPPNPHLLPPHFSRRSTEEDTVELITINSYSPDYWRKYLRFLTSKHPLAIKERQKYGLRYISPPEGEALDKLITQINETST